jgi:hypothetical protein
VLTTGNGTFSFSASSLTSNYQFGLVMVATASLLSGMSAALTQQALVDFRKRQPFFFSAEMAFYGIFFLLINLLFNNDIKGGSLFSNWDLLTLIPVITNVSHLFCVLTRWCLYLLFVFIITFPLPPGVWGTHCRIGHQIRGWSGEGVFSYRRYFLWY